MSAYLRCILYPVLLLLAQLSSPALAQEKTLDFLGEVNDAEHPAGYRDYVENGCWQCHGFQGQGTAGPALAPNPLPYEAFSTYVRKPGNVMPAYSSRILPEDRLRRIHGYLRSIPPAPDPDSIPLLSGE
jgi:mono/diheme cytochrome c family protein